MDRLNSLIDSDFIDWLASYNFQYSHVKDDSKRSSMNLFYNDILCINVVDNGSHTGFGIDITLADINNTSPIGTREIWIHSAFKYFKIKQPLLNRAYTESQYKHNLLIVIDYISILLPKLSELNLEEWVSMNEWVEKERLEAIKLHRERIHRN